MKIYTVTTKERTYNHIEAKDKKDMLVKLNKIRLKWMDISKIQSIHYWSNIHQRWISMKK
jgi:hypothetical protein